jgi:N-Acetylglucosaminyltransferase-IV (GnT-IV) conserved region.
VSIPLELLSHLTECFVTCSCDYVILLFRFSEQVESGLIEVISPPASYYPDMENLRNTLGDSPERVRWRTKQNLDFAFLMMYSQPKATFYVQLEDDILAKRNFISIMKNYALQKISEKSPWFVLEFCQLGFIGEGFCSFLKQMYKYNF